jgi:putative phosphoesterase
MPGLPAPSGSGRSRSGRSPGQSRQSATLRLRDDGRLTLACVADTHSQPHAATAERLAAIAPDAILHAGDIGDPAVIEQLAEIAPVHAVRGNIDTRSTFPDVLVLDVLDDDNDGAAGPRLRIYMTHIAVHGPRLHADVARAANAAKAGLVVCGHSHVPFIGRDRELVVFNPGSIGPRRFQLPIVLGTLTIAPGPGMEGPGFTPGPGVVRMGHIDCETGRPWSPPG